MAYPFTPMPKFSEFKVRLEAEFGCLFKTETNGTPLPIQYFEKSVNGRVVRCVIRIDNENDIMTPSVLRSICTRLKIDLGTFGLILG